MMRAAPLFWTLICAMVFTTAWGCQADDEIKQGAEGEVCSVSDDDCRQGHVCDRGFCRATVVDGSNCEAMCERIALCEAEEPDCLEACFATINGNCASSNPCPWSDGAVEVFGACIVDELSCEQIRNQNTQAICLDRVEVDPSRAEICSDLTRGVLTCNADADPTELVQRCELLARTATDEGFERAQTCMERVDDGFCSEIEACLNSVFLLNPPLDLGDSTVPGSE